MTSTAPLPSPTGEASGGGSTRTTTLPMALPVCRNRNASTSWPLISNTSMGSGCTSPASARAAKFSSMGTIRSGSSGSTSFSECVWYTTSGRRSLVCSWLQMLRLPISTKRPLGASNATDSAT